MIPPGAGRPLTRASGVFLSKRDGARPPGPMLAVLTVVERTLVEAGEPTQVRETRLVFSDAMRDRFAEDVERIVGRRVLGVTSQVLVTRDVVIEMFVLEHVSSPPGA